MLKGVKVLDDKVIVLFVSSLSNFCTHNRISLRSCAAQKFHQAPI
jgi:hypothetical protein